MLWDLPTTLFFNKESKFDSSISGLHANNSGDELAK